MARDGASEELAWAPRRCRPARLLQAAARHTARGRPRSRLMSRLLRDAPIRRSAPKATRPGLGGGDSARTARAHRCAASRRPRRGLEAIRGRRPSAQQLGPCPGSRSAVRGVRPFLSSRARTRAPRATTKAEARSGSRAKTRSLRVRAVGDPLLVRSLASSARVRMHRRGARARLGQREGASWALRQRGTILPTCSGVQWASSGTAGAVWTATVPHPRVGARGSSARGRRREVGARAACSSARNTIAELPRCLKTSRGRVARSQRACGAISSSANAGDVEDLPARRGGVDAHRLRPATVCATVPPARQDHRARGLQAPPELLEAHDLPPTRGRRGSRMGLRHRWPKTRTWQVDSESGTRRRR